MGKGLNLGDRAGQWLVSVDVGGGPWDSARHAASGCPQPRGWLDLRLGDGKRVRKNSSARNLGTWQSPDTLLGSEGPSGGGQAWQRAGKPGVGGGA